MTLHAALAFSALAAATLLFFGGAGRLVPVIALAAAGLEVAIALGVLRISVAQLPLALVLGFGLALPGVVAWARASGKATTSAAAILAFVGVLQVAVYVAPRI